MAEVTLQRFQVLRYSVDGFISVFQVQKLQSIIASRGSQYNHEMKRKEREFNKLKERLNQLLSDKREKKQGWLESSESVTHLALNVEGSFDF